MKANESKLRRPLLWIWLILALGALAYLKAPAAGPWLFERYFAEKNWTAEGCELAYETPSSLRGGSCVLRLPFEKETLMITLPSFTADLAAETLTAPAGAAVFGEYASDFRGKLFRSPNGKVRIEATLENPRGPAPLIIESGRYTVSVTLGENADYVLSGHGVSGRYGEIRFEKASGTIKLGHFPEWKTERADIRIFRIDNGFPLENLRFKLRLNKGPRETSNVDIEEFSAEALGGKLAVNKLSVRNNKPGAFVLRVDSIDLAQLLAFVGDKVQGTGKVSGELPIEFIDGKVTVDSGKLAALPPGGTIRYSAAEGSALKSSEDPNVQLAARALENLSFDSMAADVAYDKEGNMTAAVALDGKNPELSSRPIRFNINIEQNIPMLLRSIRLATKAEEEILRPGKK